MTTELQPHYKIDEPVREAAQLLRRIGFFLLFGAAPAFAPYYKRSIFLFTTIGAVLLVLAAFIEGAFNLKRFVTPSLSLAVVLIAIFVYVFWSGLSLAWTPFPGESGTLYATFIVIILAGLLLVLLLPDRVSASRLYALVGGVTIGWIICLGSSFAPAIEIAYPTVERSLVTLIPLTPPTLIWLMYRRRGLLAFILAIMASVAVVMLNSPVMMLAFASSLIILLTALALPDQTRRGAAYATGLTVLFAPLIPILFALPITWVTDDESKMRQIFDDWYRIVVDDPFRLLTGHGYDTILRAVDAGLIPQTSPHGLLIDTWFELGLIGSAALAALIAGVVMSSSLMTRPSAAALLSSIVAVFIIGTFGGNLPQAPWLVSIAIAAVAISALERGQYKTARPRSGDIAALNVKKGGFSFLPDWLEI